MSKMPLKNAQDCREWLDRAINEMKESPTAIALGNARAKIVLGFDKLAQNKMSYIRHKQKFGAALDLSNHYGS